MSKPKTVVLSVRTSVEMKAELERLARDHWDGEVNEFILEGLRRWISEHRESERQEKINEIIREWNSRKEVERK